MSESPNKKYKVTPPSSSVKLSAKLLLHSTPVASTSTLHYQSRATPSTTSGPLPKPTATYYDPDDDELDAMLLLEQELDLEQQPLDEEAYQEQEDYYREEHPGESIPITPPRRRPKDAYHTPTSIHSVSSLSFLHRKRIYSPASQTDIKPFLSTQSTSTSNTSSILFATNTTSTTLGIPI